MEKVAKHPLYNPAGLRNKLKTFYKRKFFNAFSSLFKWSGYFERDRETLDKINLLLWNNGSFAFYPSYFLDNKLSVDDARKLIDKIGGAKTFIASNYAVDGVNIYNKPAFINPIIDSPIKFRRTQTKLLVNSDCLLCYIDPYSASNGESLGVYKLIEAKINQIINAEMTIFTNVILHKLPYEIFTEEDNKNAIASVLNQLFNDEIAVFATGVNPDAIKPFNNGVPEIYLNMYGYVRSLENEVYSLIGLDNGAVIKMAERSTVDEANANNVQTNANALMYLEQMKRFADDANALYGLDMSVRLANEMSTSVHNDVHGQDNEDREGGDYGQ